MAIATARGGTNFRAYTAETVAITGFVSRGQTEDVRSRPAISGLQVLTLQTRFRTARRLCSRLSEAEVVMRWSNSGY